MKICGTGGKAWLLFMKKIMVAAMAVVICLALAACGKENVITGYKSGDVKLGQYKGLTYTLEDSEVTDGEVLNRALTELSREKVLKPVEGRTIVENGDVVDVDYVGRIDGEDFARGTGTKSDLVIGAEGNTFFEGFDKALVGKEIGQFTIEITFPDPYYLYPSLAGKNASFEVNLKAINQYVQPELNDEWVEMHTKGAQKTLLEYKSALAEQIKAEKDAANKSEKNYQVIKAVFANSGISKDLSKEITEYKEQLINVQNSMAESYGMTGDKYFAYKYGLNTAYFEQYMEAQAKINIQFNFICSAIAEEEKLTASDEEIETFATAVRANYGCDTNQALYEFINKQFEVDGKEYIAENVKLNKAKDLIFNSAVQQ